MTILTDHAHEDFFGDDVFFGLETLLGHEFLDLLFEAREIRETVKIGHDAHQLINKDESIDGHILNCIQSHNDYFGKPTPFFLWCEHPPNQEMIESYP